MGITGYISIGLPLGPNTETDPVFITDPQYGLGGLRTVETIQKRNEIVTARRQVGMMVYVQEDDNYYSLIGGIDNSNWVEFSIGVGTPGATGATGTALVLIDEVSTTIDDFILKGSQPYSLSGDILLLKYSGGILPATGGVFLTDPTKGTGFPVYFPSTGLTGIQFTNQTLTGNLGDTITLRIVVTGPGNSPSTDIYDYDIVIGNEIRWGGSNYDNLSGTGIQQELDNSIGSNSLSHVFTESLTSGNYLFVAYPTRLGEARIAINNAAYGGTKLQGYGGIPGNSIVNSINVNGYLEPFYVYRSEHPLGLSLEVKIAEQ
jgi:hypothetical protein